MNLKRRLTIALVVLTSLIALLYVNRLHLFKYSLGWYTDLIHPRSPNVPVPWMDGPQQAATPINERPPNVIIILADDMGINDVTTHGGGLVAEGVPTPHIDSIARDGVRFDQGYSGAPVCTVSRAALLTGRYPWRFGVEFTPTPGAMARVAGALYADPKALHPVIIDQAKAELSKDFNDLGMPPGEVTMAETLKARGYHTLHIGKWHLGSTAAMRPNNQGFDETLFIVVMTPDTALFTFSIVHGLLKFDKSTLVATGDCMTLLAVVQAFVVTGSTVVRCFFMILVVESNRIHVSF